MSLHKNILGGIAMGNFNIKGLTPKSVGGVLILLLALIAAFIRTTITSDDITFR